MNKDWKIFTNAQAQTDAIKGLPAPPPWRNFLGVISSERGISTPSPELKQRGEKFQAPSDLIQMVNAALCLRRPLLITGDPGTGKSSLIYAVAYELKLGEVLRWSITSKSSLPQGLYQYDAIGRLQESQLRLAEAQSSNGNVKYEKPDIGKFIKLGPLGTALLPTDTPRALLIDEIDKSDLDLPNDLLHVFEEGEFELPELKRESDREEIEVEDALRQPTTIRNGLVKAKQFPFVVMTSNGERDFPAPFLRRCLRFEMPKIDQEMLSKIVTARLGEIIATQSADLIDEFLKRRKDGIVAIDQLLNASFLLKNNFQVNDTDKEFLKENVLTPLDQ